MSNMTNRISDSQFAEIAKQKYETEKLNKIPGVVIDLPSKGLVYPKSSVLRNGSVEIRYMTAYDEDILTNKNYIDNGILFEKLLESVIITPGVQVKELIDADKEWLIIMIRATSYEAEYPVSVTTPDDQTITANVNLYNLKFKSFTLQSDDAGLFEFKTNSRDILKFRFIPSSLMKTIPTDHAISYILNNTIMQVNDITDKSKISEWIRFEFLRKDSSEFRKYMQLHVPKINLEYEFTYTTQEGKQESFLAGFQIGSDFFWL